MSETPQRWMPRETWDALIRGEGCPLCAEVQSTETENEYGLTIADLSISRLRLARNQYVKGYCVLICHRHVREPYELAARERQMFFEDMCAAGAALERAFGADKMNFEILGNAVPHLHAHIKPRYYGDPAPSRPLWADAEIVHLTVDEYAARIALINQHLSTQQPHNLKTP
jgi:diadenosine tetraphosphate (Ap4A) HIT family hydrolase